MNTVAQHAAALGMGWNDLDERTLLAVCRYLKEEVETVHRRLTDAVQQRQRDFEYMAERPLGTLGSRYVDTLEEISGKCDALKAVYGSVRSTWERVVLRRVQAEVDARLPHTSIMQGPADSVLVGGKAVGIVRRQKMRGPHAWASLTEQGGVLGEYGTQQAALHATARRYMFDQAYSAELAKGNP